MPYAAITGWGHHVPARVLTNADLETLVDTSNDWIRSRTGILRRHVAAPGESTASMCAQAARRALARSETDPLDVDLVICATTTPDHLLPATACLVQEQLGAANAGAFDINSACTGFLNCLIVGSQFIRAGSCERVLVVAGETLSRFVNWKDRDTCVLFGDGAAAVVLEATEQECGVVGSVMGCRGDAGRLLAIEAGGSARPTTAATVAAGQHYVTMRGGEVFRLAVRAMVEAARAALTRAELSADDVAVVVPHQANVRIIEAVRQALGLPQARVFVNVDRFGNTGAASVGIALAEVLDGTGVAAGDHLLLVSFGGGLTWAAAVVRQAAVRAPHPAIGLQRLESLRLSV
jgi:3-oxoacyl-[acyl-carrier-protein] synthase-3